MTIKAIEASATVVFCQDGYDRASLREIADHAGVSLSSIHEYFESKAGLYVSVGRNLFERLESQRLELLEHAIAGGHEPDLEALIHCVVAPVVLPEFMSEQENPWGPKQMRSWYDTASYLADDPKLVESLRASVTRWTHQIERCCPGLNTAQARLAYALIVSAMFSWASTNHYFDETLGITPRLSPEQECRNLVSMIAAGIRAMVSSGDGGP